MSLSEVWRFLWFLWKGFYHSLASNDGKLWVKQVIQQWFDFFFFGGGEGEASGKDGEDSGVCFVKTD